MGEIDTESAGKETAQCIERREPSARAGPSYRERRGLTRAQNAGGGYDDIKSPKTRRNEHWGPT